MKPLNVKKEASDMVEDYYNDALETMLDVQSPHCWCVNSQKLRNDFFLTSSPVMDCSKD